MEPEKIYEHCVDSLARFVHGAGFEDVVIGLSGGIDSSLVAVMAVDALGNEHVHGLLLPGPYSSADSIEDALELSRNLKIEHRTISIKEPYEAFAHVISEAIGDALGGLAAENTQARCRMICLMALSNMRGWMMLNTGNRSEAAMGYSTLYGDTAGAFAPIGGIYKTDVYKLAIYRNGSATAKGDIPPIPENVISKPPSAELAPDQLDEISMGIEYPLLDEILRALNDSKLTIDELVSRGYNKDQVMMVANRYAAYQFKRDLEPPFPDLGFYV